MVALKTSRPQFFMETKQNKSKSEAAGRPIFEEIERVRVFIPGDRLFTPVFPVGDKHKAKWPEEYAAFKRGETRAASGTPLEHWPILTRGRVAELKALNILSVEELAGVADGKLGALGTNARSERDQARSFLETASSGAAASKAAAENAELHARINAMQEQMERLMAAKAAPEAPVEASERRIDEHSDEELRAYLFRETGERPGPRTSRETLIQRATDIATKVAEAA